jgi:class 3 adenylate cyclase
MNETDQKRLEIGLADLKPRLPVDDLRTFIREAADEDLFHIDADRLADSWNVRRRDVLEILLQAVRSGVLTMEWVFHCPNCGGVAKESLQLASAREHDFCPVCRVNFQNTLDETVEVFFSISPDIRKISGELKEEYEARIVDDITRTGKYEWRSSATTTGVEIINHPVFRKIFGEETLPLDQSLEIRTATIMFSDVIGSTAMYERLGDSRAYRLIRDHFDVVFEAITEHDGVPIKTIGDAVMGVFIDEVSAVQAAFAMSNLLQASNRTRNDGESLRLKIGVHRGPLIAVTLNNQLDYFGRTVNIAARTQNLSGPDQLSMGEAFIAAPGVKTALLEHVRRVQRTAVTMKGIDGRVRVYKIPLANAAGTDAP